MPAPAVGRSVSDAYKPLLPNAQTPAEQRLFAMVDDGLKVLPQDRIQNMQGVLDRLQTALPVDEDYQTKVRNTTEQSPTSESKNLLAPILLLSLTTLVCIGLWWWLGDAQLAPSEMSAHQNPQQPIARPSIDSELSSSSAPAVAPSKANSFVGNPIHVNYPLAPLVIGKDLLQFTVESELEGFISVFFLSTDGSIYRLSPARGKNPVYINKGEQIAFPDTENPLISAGPEGVNRFLVGIAPKPLDYKLLSEEPVGELHRLGQESLTLDQIPSVLTSQLEQDKIYWTTFTVAETY